MRRAGAFGGAVGGAVDALLLAECLSCAASDTGELADRDTGTAVPTAVAVDANAGRGRDDAARLLRLDSVVLRTQIVDRESSEFARVALADFRVLAPGGMLENRTRAIAGVTAWNARAIRLSDREAVLHGDVALVTGRLDVDGEMQPVGRWGPIKYTSTWVREGGDWRLFSRSLTPCLDRLVAMGRC